MGLALYHFFDDETHHLVYPMRQQGAENELFRAELGRLANGTFSSEDWESWKDKCNLNNLCPQERRDIEEEATMICSMTRNMTTFNASHVKDLGTPICKMEAINRPHKAKTYSSKDMGNLKNEEFVAKGAKIILKQNLWTDAKLVNGSIGYVR